MIEKRAGGTESGPKNRNGTKTELSVSCFFVRQDKSDRTGKKKEATEGGAGTRQLDTK